MKGFQVALVMQLFIVDVINMFQKKQGIMNIFKNKIYY
jgi:hypothetical protein